jgi:hypothetical protein
VHQDTHVALPCTRSKAHAKAEAARLLLQASQEGDLAAAKENVRPAALMSMMPLATKGKAVLKGDVVPRRSARLRTNNNGCVPPSQKKAVVVVPEARGYGRRWRTLHESSLQF